MSTILDALKRVEEQLRKDARHKTGLDASSAEASPAASGVPGPGSAPGESDEVVRVYLSLVDMLSGIQDRVRIVADEERAETKRAYTELAQGLASLQHDLASQREALKEEVQQRKLDRETGTSAVAAAQSQADSVKQILAKSSQANEGLAQEVTGLHNDLTSLKETLQEEIRRRDKERETGETAKAAAQSQADSLKQILAESGQANAVLAEEVAVLQSSFASLRETLQEEIRQRDRERETGETTVAAAQSQADSLKQVLAKNGQANAVLTEEVAALQSDFASLGERLQEEIRQRDTERETGETAVAAAQSRLDSFRQALAETSAANAGLTQAIAAFQSDLARLREAFQEDGLRRDAECEAGKVAVAAAQSQVDSLQQTLAETAGANTELLQPMAALQSDFACLREAFEKERRQRDAEREDGKAAVAAAQSQVDSLQRILAETAGANTELLQPMAALQNDFVCLREAFEKERRQRDEEHEAGKLAVAAAQSQVDSLQQVLAETAGANTELLQPMAALQNNFACLKEAFEKERRQRDEEHEAGKAAWAASKFETDSLRRTLDEASAANAGVTQAVAAFQSDLARQREALHDESQQRVAEREAGHAALAAAQAQVDSLRQTLAEAAGTNAELLQPLAALQSDVARLREALQEERRRRDEDREAGDAALAAAQAQVDSLGQALAETVGANTQLAQNADKLTSDLTRVKETLQEEAQQRVADRETQEAASAAVQAQADFLKQIRAEAAAATAHLARMIETLRNELARLREALQEEVERRGVERKVGETALAAVQAQMDSLSQTLIDHEEAIADAQDKSLHAMGEAAGDGRYRAQIDALGDRTKPVMELDKNDALRLHKAAVEAYNKGSFSEALELLDTIDAAFPNNKSVLYNRAECLASLGRKDEAREVCDYLIDSVNYKPAKELMRRLTG